MYKYKYEMHLHSCEASLCAVSTSVELVKAYKNAGYTGFVLTNHFIHGNTSVSNKLSWEDRMLAYYKPYLKAKEEGEKLDFDVFYGVEHNYGNGKELLIYGLDLEFWLKYPQLRNAQVDEFCKIVHQEGGLIYHAHPRRVRNYITPGIEPRYDLCDGIEIYNAGDDSESNHKAYEDAVYYNKKMLSGGDIHQADCEKIGSSGIISSNRIKTNKDLIDLLNKNNYRLLFNGEVMK